MIKRIAFALSLLASTTYAQHPNVASGFSPTGTYDALGIDTVNDFNGTLTLHIPLGPTYPVSKALSYNLTLVYNSHPWATSQRYDNGTIYTDVYPAASNAGLGWILSLGRLYAPTDTGNTTNKYVFEAADGSQHAFYNTLRDCDTAGNCDIQIEGIYYTRDGSYLRLRSVTTTTGAAGWDVEYPNGTIYEFANGLQDVQQIRDRYNNTVTVSVVSASMWCASGGGTLGGTGMCGGSRTIGVQDSTGRTHYIKYKLGSGPQLQGNANPLNWYVESVDLAGFNGSRNVYTFENYGAWIPRGCAGNLPDPTLYPYTYVALLYRVLAPGADPQQTHASSYIVPLKTVTAPDGTPQTMPEYSNSTDCSTGLINKLITPVGAQLEWDYQHWLFTNPTDDAGHPRYSVPGMLHRRLRAKDGTLIGQWTYGTNLQGPSNCYPVRCFSRELINTVTPPIGVSTERHFSVMVSEDPGATNSTYNPYGYSPAEYGLPLTHNVTRNGRVLSSRTFDGATLKRSTYVRYEHDGGMSFTETPQESNARLVTQETVFHDDGDRVADTTWTSFDGLGHFRQETRNGTFDDGTSHTTYADYLNSLGTLTVDANGTRQPGFTMLSPGLPWVLNVFTTTYETEAPPNVPSTSSFQEYCFDANTGFLLRHRKIAAFNLSPGWHDTLTVFTPDAQGNVAREEYSGGDTGWTSPTTNLCTAYLYANSYRVDHTYQYGVRATSTYVDGGGAQLSFKALDQDIDQNTGLASVMRDAAGNRTVFDYDNRARVRTTTPTDPNGTTGNSTGKTQYTYTDATDTGRATLLVTQLGSDATTVRAQQELTYDDAGRLMKARHLLPNHTWSARTYEYNAVGWETLASEEETDPPVHGTATVYDAFGRPTSVIAADGSTTTYAYTGVGMRQRSSLIRTSGTGQTLVQTTSTTTEKYDRRGRLYQVIEPSTTGGATTTYAYAPEGQLAQAIMTGGPEGTQTRTFSYDGRGFLVSEQHPELGTSGNGSTTYTYDATGHVTRRTNDINVSFEYDRAQRLTRVLDDTKVLKEFVYDSTNSQGYSRGKLKTATRHSNFLGGDVSITQTYYYNGRDGRLSRYDTSGPASFTQSFAYNDAGQRETTTYATAPSVPTFTVTNGYTNGLLTNVNGWASLTYHPNGLVNQVTFANGLTWTQQNDPTGMPRPSRIQTVGNAWGGNWDSGAYQYDGSGNVASIGSDYYVYDSVDRLTLGTTNSASDWRSYTYDTFGNIKTISGSSGTQYLYPTLTNRLSGAGYDARGNVLSYTTTSYSYDGLNMTSYINAGTGQIVPVYDASDERIATYDVNVGSWTWFLRDPDGRLLSEITNPEASPSVKHYVYRGTVLLGTYEPTTWVTTRYAGVDHLGSPRILVNNDGYMWSARANFLPFGQELGCNDAQRAKFTGQQRDWPCSNIPVDNFHAREYNPIVGRFLSVDPVTFNYRSPQSWNRYAYVLNNPLRYTDPYGLFECDGKGRCWDNITVTPGGFDWAGFNSFLNFGQQYMNGFPGLHDNFGRELGNAAYLSPGDFFNGRATVHGLEAFVDGVAPDIPFCDADVCQKISDPFAANSFYDINEPGMHSAQVIGAVTRDAEIALASTGSSTLFGKGSWINRNPLGAGRFRLGHSLERSTRTTFFSARGKWIDAFYGAPKSHSDLWIIK